MKKSAHPSFLPHFFRLFFLQGLWNYQNLQGTGFLFALIPFLRKNLPDEANNPVKYHSFFNTHPYLASLAVGATLRRETEQPRDQASIQTFHLRLSGPFGLAGDSLFWRTIKPAYALLGLLISYILYGDSLAPVAAAAGFLFVYNTTHLWVRWWGLRKGWELGDKVLTVLGKPPLAHLQSHAAVEGAVLLGLVAGAVLITGTTMSLWAPVILMIGGILAWAGTMLRLSVPWVTGIALILLLISGTLL
jgi:PTS system mannose-specific IID component